MGSGDERDLAEFDVRCPTCGGRAVASMVPDGTKGTYREALVKLGASRITCLRCGSIRDLPPGRRGEYELWYATDFDGHRLWATSLEHLDALIAWLSGGRGLRRPSFPESVYWEALPRWLRVRKNRAAILERLIRLRER